MLGTSDGTVSTQTSIESTVMRWNPIVAGTKESPGCKHWCADNMVYRMQLRF